MVSTINPPPPLHPTPVYSPLSLTGVSVPAAFLPKRKGNAPKTHMYSSSGSTSKSNRHRSSLQGNMYVDVTLAPDSAYFSLKRNKYVI